MNMIWGLLCLWALLGFTFTAETADIDNRMGVTPNTFGIPIPPKGIHHTLTATSQGFSPTVTLNEATGDLLVSGSTVVTSASVHPEDTAIANVGPSMTTIIIATTTITSILSVIDPSQLTQTVTVTVTSPIRGPVLKDEVGTTAVTSATIPGTLHMGTSGSIVTVSATLTVSVFSTVFVGPKTASTVTVTTTVFGSTSGSEETMMATSGALPTDSLSSSSSKPTPMMTMMTSTSSATSTASVPPGNPVEPMDSGQESGITQNRALLATLIISVFILFCFFVWGLHRIRVAIARRRKKKTVLRELVLPRTGAAAGIAGAMRSHSQRGTRLSRPPMVMVRRPSQRSSNGSPVSSTDGNSGLTGEGEVRIVIRPAPRRRTASSQFWPVPPGHRGPTFSMFVEEETTSAADTTPHDPETWSLASAHGSPNDSPTPYAGSGPVTPPQGIIPHRPGPTASSRRFGSQRRAAPQSTSDTDPSSDMTSFPGLGTLLSPTPASHGRNNYNLTPWESHPTWANLAASDSSRPSTPNRSTTGSPRSARTERSGTRPLLGGSRRYPDII